MQHIRSNLLTFLSHPKLQAIVVSAVGGTIAGGALGAAAGLVLGAIIGALVGILFAFFTLGLSIPVGAVIGGIFGANVGAAIAGGIGFLSGGVAGYVEIPQGIWRKAEQIRDYKKLLLNGEYGTSNHLTQVRSGRDIANRFNTGSNTAVDIGHRINQYLQNAVKLYDTLKDNKTRSSPLSRVGKPWESVTSPSELRGFESIVGNYDKTIDHERWMLVKREAQSSPIGKRELWLVVCGNTTWEDWSQHADAFAPPADVGLDDVGICSGLYNKAQSIINDIMSKQALEAIRKEAYVPFEKIFIVGFGLGGAIATEFQSFTAVPFASPDIHMSESAQDAFRKLQQIWMAALGVSAFMSITTKNVYKHFLTFALEPAPAFKSKRGPKYWEADAYALQTKDSFVKRVLEQTLVSTIYGEDPLPRLNVEIAGCVLPPIKLGIFYSSSYTKVMPKKNCVDVNTFYLMDGPLTDNGVARFMTWFSAHGDTLGSRITQAVNAMRALDEPKLALHLAGGKLADDQVAMFRPETFINALEQLSQNLHSSKVSGA